VTKLVMKSVVVNAAITGDIPGVFLDAAAAVGVVKFALLVVSLGVGVAAAEVRVESIFGTSDVGSVDMGDSVFTSPRPVASLVAPAKLVVIASVVVVWVSVTVTLPLVVVMRVVSVLEAWSTQPTLPLINVGTASDSVIPPVMFIILQVSPGPPPQLLVKPCLAWFPGAWYEDTHQSKIASPSGSSRGMASSATWGPMQLTRSNRNVMGRKSLDSDFKVASQGLPRGL
jgi:hypothetical protein